MPEAEAVVGIILVSGLVLCAFVATAIWGVRSLFNLPGRREFREMKQRLAALEEHCKLDAERLETVRDLLLSSDLEARRRLSEALQSDAASEPNASSKWLNQQG
ncbi:MAG TPA: hypothetical protein VGN26_19215 [Armatimonadota bacterium]